MLLPGANVGFILLMAATACLGSWPNFFRAFPHGLRPEYPFFDFTWTGLGVALSLALMFGNTGFEIPDFLPNMQGLREAPLLILWSLLAGACLAIGNMLYLQGMNATGQTMAAPVSNGISLVIGLGLIYSFRGIPGRTDLLLQYLFPGLVLISVAVVCAAVAQILKVNHQRAKARRETTVALANGLHTSSDDVSLLTHSGDESSTTAASTNTTAARPLAKSDEHILASGIRDTGVPVLEMVPMKPVPMNDWDVDEPENDEPANVATEVMMKVLPGPKAQRSQIHAFFVCAIGGVILGGWRVFSNLALQPGYLTPYSANFLFFSGSAIGYLIISPILILRPFTGKRGNIKEYSQHMQKAQHWQAVVSGFLFTFGVCLMFIAEQGTGYAVCFIFSQSAPLLVSLWGIIYWREFADTPHQSKLWLGWMFATYLVGLFVILLSHFPVLSLI